MKLSWEMEKYFDISPEFCTRLVNATALHSHSTGCITPVSSNVTSLTPTHLAVGQLPSMQQYPQIRDPEWLKVEVCREFQRGACKRTADECRYAHPSKNIQVSSDGKVIACYDALKGRCNRESCKYLHPTYQLKQQLEITGRQTLMQNRAMLQQMLPLQQVQTATLPQGSLVGYEQVATGSAQPMVSPLHANQLYSHAVAAPPGSAAAYSVLQPSDIAALNHHIMPYYPIAAAPTQIAAMVPTAGSLRADKLEVCRDFQRGNCTRGPDECRYGHPNDRSMIDVTDNTVTVCMDCIKGRCTREKCKYFHPPPHLQAKIRAAQNPAAAFLPPLTPATIATPQPNVMTASKRMLTVEDVMASGTALGQPPLKRHAIETSMITSVGNGIGNSPGLTSSTSSSPNPSLAALYGYNNAAAAVPALTSMHHQTLPTAPAYYQQAVPMLHLQYGATAGALAPGQTTTLTPFGIPTSNSTTANGSPAPYALLNGQNQQLAGDSSSKPAQHHVSNTSFGATSLTVCRDYQSGKCVRPFCRFVHVNEDSVEVKDDRVTVCRNAIQGKCFRQQCKFYHFPSSTTQPTSIVEVPYVDHSNRGINGLPSPNLIGVIANGSVATAQPPYSAVLAEGQCI